MSTYDRHSLDFSEHSVHPVVAWRRILDLVAGHRVQATVSTYEYESSEREEGGEYDSDLSVQLVEAGGLQAAVEEIASRSFVEAGLDSVAFVDCRLRHVPMLDMVGAPDREMLRQMEYILTATDYDADELLVYHSGQSAHAYGTRMLDTEDWLAWIKLAGTQGRVDGHWLQHCRERGYATLRWTAGHSHYLQVPRLIGQLDQLLALPDGELEYRIAMQAPPPRTEIDLGSIGTDDTDIQQLVEEGF